MPILSTKTPFRRHLIEGSVAGLGMGVTAIVRIGLDRKPFSAVLKAIYSGFGHRYGSTEQLKLEDEDEAAAEAELKKLETHDWLYNILWNALEDSEWKAATDGRVDQEVLEDDKYLTNRAPGFVRGTSVRSRE